jgi:hypothetical protein
MLHLIKMWLEAPIEETDERGNKHRSTRNRDEGRGTPQGSPISIEVSEPKFEASQSATRMVRIARTSS